MLITDILKQEETAKTEKRIRELNLSLMEGVKGRFGLSQVPEELIELLDKVTLRIGKIIAILATELEKKPGQKFEKGDIAIVISPELDRKTGFPLLFLSMPQLEAKILEERKRSLEKEKRQRENFQKEEWLKRRVKLLQEKGVEASPTFRKFVRDLPPMKTGFDGSATRVAKLLHTRENAKMYGTVEDAIFAVSYNNADGLPQISIYVKEIDYVEEFAQRLTENLGVPPKVATKISQALPHDMWYGMFDEVSHRDGVLDYAMRMGRYLHLPEGAVAHDLLQGDVKIAVYQTTSEDRKYLANIDPAKPSAFLIGNKLNVYLP